MRRAIAMRRPDWPSEAIENLPKHAWSAFCAKNDVGTSAPIYQGDLKVRQFAHALPEIDLREPTQFAAQPG